MADHKRLMLVCQGIQTYLDGANDNGGEWLPDCSCGCKHFHPLEGDEGMDWGVCTQPQCPRAGLLTFEHQYRCKFFERENDNEFTVTCDETNNTPEGMKQGEFNVKIEIPVSWVMPLDPTYNLPDETSLIKPAAHSFTCPNCLEKLTQEGRCPDALPGNWKCERTTGVV